MNSAEEIVKRAEELFAEGRTRYEVSDLMRGEGYTSPKGKELSPERVYRLCYSARNRENSEYRSPYLEVGIDRRLKIYR